MAEALQADEKADRHQTSCGLKHEAERWCNAQGHPNGYVSNGALLMAAYVLGFKVYHPIKRPDFPNAFVNISRHRPRAKTENALCKIMSGGEIDDQAHRQH
jgi:hypothetical protein